jgi:hypothetical protein
VRAHHPVAEDGRVFGGEGGLQRGNSRGRHYRAPDLGIASTKADLGIAITKAPWPGIIAAIT